MFRRSFTVLLAAAVLAASLPTAAATQPPAPVQEQPGGRGISVEFEGGTVAEYVQSLRIAATEPVNVAIAPAAAGVAMPAISMQSVSLDEALSAIPMVAETPANLRLAVRVLGEGGGILGPGDQANYSYAIAADRGPQARRATQLVEVFSLHELLKLGVPAPTVLTAVETALQLDADDGESTMLFHEESGLLLVRGTQQHTMVVRRVLEELATAGADRQAETRAGDRERNREQLRHDLERAYNELVHAELRRQAVEQEAGAAGALEPMPPDEMPAEAKRRLFELRQRALGVKMNVTKLSREVERLERLVTELELQRFGLRSDGPGDSLQGERRPQPQDDQAR